MIKVKNIEITADKIVLNTEQGKGFYPFLDSLPLQNATQTQRSHFTLSPFGIHWAELDEDLCFDGFIFEKPLNDRVRYLA
jgi:hypothetical protein